MHQAAIFLPHPPMASLLILIRWKRPCSEVAFHWLTFAYFFFAEDFLIGKLFCQWVSLKRKFFAKLHGNHHTLARKTENLSTVQA